MLKKNEMLIVSSPNHGGLYGVCHDKVQLIDDTSTTGIWTDGKLFFRAVQRDTFSEIIIYDNKGNNLSWIHLDIDDIHDVLFMDNYLFVVSTTTNEVVKLSKFGTIIERFAFPGINDAWHLNCLDFWNNKLVVSAFGEFYNHREFKGKTKGNGFIMELASREKLITGLSQPHSPKSFKDERYVCDSETKRLLIYDSNFKLMNEIGFESYTRGLAISEEFIYVGLSSSRNIQSEEKGSKVIVLNKNDYSIVNEYRIPTNEIYEIKLIPTNWFEAFDFSKPFSVINKYENELLEKGNTLVSKEEWIQELSQWGKKLDLEIQRKNEVITSKEERIQELSQWTKKLDLVTQEKDGIIASKEERIQELSRWAQKLDIEIQEKEGDIRKQRENIESLNFDNNKNINKISELEIINFKKDDEISVLLEQQSALQLENDQQKSIINKLKEIEEEYQQAEQQTLNYLAHINQLLQKERDLNNILKSGGWKFLCKYYWLRDKLLPDNSKRRLLAKLTVKTLKNPKLMFKSFNKQNVKKLKYYLKTDNIKLVESRINNYVERYEEPPSREIKIIEKSDLKEKITFPYFESPLVSIIIPVYNQWDYTYACLVSILSQTEYIPYEVIVADDLSKDETVNIKECVSNITVIRDGQNRGFLLNCNNAAKFARGKYIFFLNNDTNVQENWLQSLLELIESNSSIGMVGSKLVYPDGRLQEAGGIIWNDASGWNYGRLDDPENPKYNYVKEVDYISGTAIMIRSDLWLKIGGFDTRYVPAYFEDSDLAFEVRKHGYRVVYQPKSVIVHFEGISHGTDINKGMKAYQVLNKEKFVEKWSEVLKSENFENAKHVFLARDRSRLKKTILVIDHYVPQYDKDAGSRTAYQYLKLFVEMGFNVKFIGDNFYKHEPYASELEQLGIEILYGSWYSKHYKDWLELNGAYIDYVYLNRPHISIKYIDIVRKSTKAKIFYYGHDLHFMRELREYELTKNDALLKSAEEWKAIEVELFQKSDVIYYPSQVEVTEIHKLNPSWNAKAIPAYIYEADTPQYKEEDFKYRKDLLFVGGFGHRPNIDAVRWFKNEIFPILNRRFPELRIHIVGSNPPQEIKDYHSPQVNITGFVSDDELISYYRSARVVVVPLRYGAGVKGKVVEALYHHLPIVTTSIGSEGLPDIDGYLIEANDTPTFAKALIDIYEDYAKLEALSNNSSEYIRSYFSKKAVLQVLEQDFQ